MKYILTTLILFIGSPGYSQVVIHGKINNYDGKSKVFYSPTVEGILTAFGNRSEEVQPSPNGNFRIRYDNEGLGTTRMGFGGLTYSFIHDGETQIELTIDQARIKFPKDKKRSDHVYDSVKQAATISIKGDFAEINRYNNRAIRTSTVAFRVSGCDYSLMIWKVGSPKKAIALIDSLIQIELDQISALGVGLKPENGVAKKVTPDLKQFLKGQVQSFYSTVFLTGMMLKRFDQATLLMKDPSAPDSIYNRTWETLVERYLLNASKKIKPIPASFEYNEFVQSAAYTVEFYRKYNFDPRRASNDELVVQRLLEPPLGVLDSLHLVDARAILAYKMHNLSRFLYTQTFYSPVLLSAVKKLKAQYPDSPLLKPYESKVALLKAYLEKSASSYDRFKIVETNFVQFNDLLDVFHGKNIFIDIWATWCAPCVNDFNYKSVLKPFISDGSIVVLYISIDKERWRKKWRENIKFNELEGYHVLANNLLIADMWKQLGGIAGQIPRYALVDKNGSMYLNDAARPSEGEELVRQLEELLEAK